MMKKVEKTYQIYKKAKNKYHIQLKYFEKKGRRRRYPQLKTKRRQFGISSIIVLDSRRERKTRVETLARYFAGVGEKL